MSDETFNSIANIFLTVVGASCTGAFVVLAFGRLAIFAFGILEAWRNNK